MTYRTIFLIFAVLMLYTPTEAQAEDDSGAMELLVQILGQTEDAGVRASLMRGMLTGLDGQRNVQQPEGWQALAVKFGKSENKEVRLLALRLSQVFGDAEATRRTLALLKNPSEDIELRRTALHALLGQQNPEVSQMLATLIDEPKLRLEAIRGYAAVENPNAAKVLLSHYADWEPPLQRAVIETLATRKQYAQALLVAMKNKTVSRDDVPAHVARSLSLILGDSFSQVYGDVQQLAEDREMMMAKYKKMLTPAAIKKADASHGRAMFTKTCAACHLLYGTGGKIGPDLTGSNRANLDYILLNSVDPSFDVPNAYKMELIQTVDGRLVSGVIAEEDAKRLILKTVEQPRLVITKEDIEARKTSPKSMMPDGQLDKMKPQQVMDLIKYLRTTKQVELPQ